jgi:hypothetical protein
MAGFVGSGLDLLAVAGIAVVSRQSVVATE